MRQLILDLLDREHGCWKARLLAGELAHAASDLHPDLVIVDGADFPRCCREELAGYPFGRIVVIGREPDRAYKAAALQHGAGAWVARDDIGDGLSAAMRRALGCKHGGCPSAAT